MESFLRFVMGWDGRQEERVENFYRICKHEREIKLNP